MNSYKAYLPKQGTAESTQMPTAEVTTRENRTNTGNIERFAIANRLTTELGNIAQNHFHPEKMLSVLERLSRR